MTTSFIKKPYLFFWIFLINSILVSSSISAQTCDAPLGLNASDVSNFHVTLNWALDTDIDHYRLRYRKLNASNWMTRNNITTNLKYIENLDSASVYVWKVQAFCDSTASFSSSWSSVDTFTTTNYPPDCNGTPNGTAFVDSCGNCVGGTTNKFACIPFSPSASISLSTLECDSISDITFITSQDPNEPDMSSAVFQSDGGYFDFTGLVTNDIIGSSDIIAGGGYINVTTTLMVDFLISSEKISVKAVDDLTGQIYGSFTIENAGGGILVVTTSAPDIQLFDMPEEEPKKLATRLYKTKK